MNRKLVQAPLLAGAILALAACGGSSDGSGDATAGGGGGASTVSVQSIAGAGKVLVDAQGDALYFNEEDAHGTIACTASCTSIWPPLTISGTAAPTAGAGVSGALGVVMRPDGGRQVTWNGKPLYTFAQDGAGEATGDGARDSFGGTDFRWHAAGKAATGSSGGGGSRGGYGY